jgi:hypothetical protein
LKQLNPKPYLKKPENNRTRSSRKIKLRKLKLRKLKPGKSGSGTYTGEVQDKPETEEPNQLYRKTSSERDSEASKTDTVLFKMKYS